MRHARRTFESWLSGKDTKTALARRLGVSRRMLTDLFRPFFDPSFIPAFPKISLDFIVLDAKFLNGRKDPVMIAFHPEKGIWWDFYPRENFAAWYAFLSHFKAPKMVVCDGQKGLLTAIRMLWPDTKIQRCHFHIVQDIKLRITSRPRDLAGKELRILALSLKDAKSSEGKDIWTSKWRAFRARHSCFETKTRTAVRTMETAMANLFTFLDFPGSPNTTNHVEGGINTKIAAAIRAHRGLNSDQKKTLVSVLLSAENRKEKPTRKFP